MRRRVLSIILLFAGAALAYASAAIGSAPDPEAPLLERLLLPLNQGLAPIAALTVGFLALVASHGLAMAPEEDAIEAAHWEAKHGYPSSAIPAIALLVASASAALAALSFYGYIHRWDGRLVGALALTGSAETAVAGAIALLGALGRGRRPLIAVPALAVAAACAAFFAAVWLLGAGV